MSCSIECELLCVTLLACATCAVQLPDEREILKRRLEAEQRRLNSSVRLTVLDSSRPGSKTGKHAMGQSAWETGAAGGNFEPITLVVKNLRWVGLASAVVPPVCSSATSCRCARQCVVAAGWQNLAIAGAA